MHCEDSFGVKFPVYLLHAMHRMVRPRRIGFRRPCVFNADRMKFYRANKGVGMAKVGECAWVWPARCLLLQAWFWLGFGGKQRWRRVCLWKR